MRADHFLRAAKELPLLELEALLPDLRPVVILAPHPDDESLGCGGLLAALAKSSRPVKIVLMSDGAGSHPGSSRYPPQRLKEIRALEMAEALSRLGLPPGILHRLDSPDGAVPHEGSELEAAVNAVLKLSVGAGTMIASLGLDPHCDHVATWKIARLAAQRLGIRLLGYPIWSWRHLYPEMLPGSPLPASEQWPGPPRGGRLDVSAFLPAKRRAVEAHQSQLGAVVDDVSGFVLSDEALSVLIDDVETYVEAEP